MAKMKRSQIETIIARELPGHRVLRNPNEGLDSAGVRQPPEASTPDSDELLRKFHLSDDFDTDYRERGTPNGTAVDDEIAIVEKINPADPLSRGNRPKAKVLSARGTVKGSQG
jgi:hypothetical protein